MLSTRASEATKSSNPSRGAKALLTHRLARIAYAGAASAAVDFAVFNLLLVTVADAGSTAAVLGANTAAFACAMVVNYSANARFTFQVRPTRRSALAYVLFTAVGLVFYNFNLWWIRGLLSADEALMLNVSKVAAMSLMVIWNYLGYQRFVFRPDVDDASERAP
jgi:putative flippase GtrA